MYNYLEAVKDDIREAINDNYNLTDFADRCEAETSLYDDLWIDDSVTGNASGSYFCNTYKAEECLAHNLDLIETVANEFGCDPVISSGYEHGAEWWDVSIRCYYLSQALAEILDEFEDDGAWEVE